MRVLEFSPKLFFRVLLQLLDHMGGTSLEPWGGDPKRLQGLQNDHFWTLKRAKKEGQYNKKQSNIKYFHLKP